MRGKEREWEKWVPNAKIESSSLFNKLGARLQLPLLIGIKSILIAFFRRFFFLNISYTHTRTMHARSNAINIIGIKMC